MTEKRWSSRVLVRYALIQVPGTVVLILVLLMFMWWIDIPGWLVWAIVLLSIVKDVIMFPFVWRSYEKDRTDNSHSLKGSLGTSMEQLAPSGHIRVRGELWRAETVDEDHQINKGETVRVLDSRGLTLIVEPDKSSTSDSIE